MREIKFRVWDNYQKKFIPLEDVVIDGNGKISITNLKSNVRGVEDLEIIFYTGRKDKNDKEIYDGHITKHPDCNDPIVIEWCWDRWIQNVYYKGEPNYGANYKWYELEIIGNIYENAALLRSKSL